MSNETKQTTVQLIYEAFKTSGRSGFAQWMMENENALKEMEKKQMLECYLKADVFPRKYEFEKWYNETYGGNK